MRGLAAIIGREFSEKWLVLVAAAAAALLPFLAPLLPGVEDVAAKDARDAGGVLVGAALAAVLGLGWGATLFGISGSNRGLGFFLSRPVGAFTLWVGRTAACCAIALVCGAIVFVPAWLADGWRIEVFSWGWAVAIALSLVLLVPVSHWLVVNLQSRSWLLVLDIAVFAGCVQVWWWATYILDDLGVWRADRWFGWFAVGCGSVGVIVASAVAVTRGRADLSGARRGLTTGLWVVLALSFPLVGSFIGWVATPTPQSFDGPAIANPNGGGSWITISGLTRFAYTSFLYDTASGRYRLTERALNYRRGAEISDSGDVAGWFVERDDGYEYVTIDLTNPEAETRPSGLWFESEPSRHTLSADGGLALVFDGHEGKPLTLYDIDSRRVVFEAPWADEDIRTFGEFVDGTHATIVRVVARSANRRLVELQIFELDLITHDLRPTGVFGPFHQGGVQARFAMEASSGRLLVTAKETALLWPPVPGSAGVSQSLLTLDPSVYARGGFLADGRIVVVTFGVGRTRVHLFTPDGVLSGWVELASEDDDLVYLGSEAASARIIVAAGTWENDVTAHLVALDSMEVTAIGRDLRPIAIMHGNTWGRASYRGEPGSPATCLMQTLTDPWQLVRLDPETLETEVILGR